MSQPPTRSRSLPDAAQMLLLAAAYAGSGYIGLQMAIPPGNVTAVWPPSGIALAAVLLWGARAWRGIWLGAWLVNMWMLSGSPTHPSIGTATVVSASIATGSTLQALVGRYLIRRLAEWHAPTEHATDVLRFAALSLAFCLIAATFGVTSLAASGLLRWADYTYTWQTWWLGDTAGVLIIAPLLLVWHSPPRWLADRRAYIEAIGLLLLLFATGQIIFGGWPFASAHISPLPYLLLPLLVWAALRFGRHGATLAIFLMTGIALWGTVRGIGPFVVGTLNESLLLLQGVISIIALTILGLTAALSEREQAEAALQAARDELERRVAERTDELQLSEACFSAAAEGSLDSFLIFESVRDAAGRISDFRFVDLNERGAQWIGLPREAIVGQHLCELLPINRTDGFFEKYARVAETGEPLEEEFALGPPDRPDIWLHHQVVPLAGGIAITSRNISERKRIEAALRASEETARRFQQHLKALHEVGIELSTIDSFDELCRRAIELGRSRLDFDRLGIWLLDDDPNFMVGTFGIDEHGQILDGRHVRLPIDPSQLVGEIYYGTLPIYFRSDTTLLDNHYGAVGRGWNAMAALWDRDRVIGYISADNLLLQQSLVSYQLELLALYGATLGHLYVRKRAEEALREREEFACRFQEQLKALHEVTIELSTMGSFDALCRRALELGRSRLGFDRLGIWFLDTDPNFMLGSFGTDEHGQIRDERGVRLPTAPHQLVMDMFYGKLPVNFGSDRELYNHKHEPMGRGWHAVAPLWDRDQIIGYVTTDNLLQQQPMSPYQLELLGLYGSTLGHLCMRKRTDDALRLLNTQLELRVAERTAQLETANQELEAFSYSVSHDLRAPLRHIDGFAQLLLKREAGKLDATSARYLRVIAESVERMGRLIDDLLALSRTGRAEMRTQLVALDALIEDVRRELAPLQRGRQLAWEIGTLPSVEADPTLLRIALVNLLANAIKYTSPRPRAHIAICATPGTDGEQIIAISDDGVGFDMQYAHKLFGVFQRLHRDDEFEGTGIGLATVRRVIHRHGGRVWAEGVPDRGATFYFTLKGAGHGTAYAEDPAGGR